MGPHFGLFPNVTSPDTVKQWSEIGIIFLLFALGLEFSFKKLLNVGSTALITAGTIFIGMFCIGLGVGTMLHWTSMESVFLGGLLSMSSTTIIIKAFDDLGLKKKPFTGIVFGTLVVEDLMAILLMVLLSTFAVSKQFAGKEMLLGLLKLVFFLILWFLVGIYVIPSLLKRGHKLFNDEMILILSVGLCFGMVMLASYAGFSSALGAFVMGSILAETIEGERIGKAVKGIKDLFGAIFFVSVGMMVDPSILVQYWLPVLVLTIVVMIGIPFFATSGVLMSGHNLSTAVRSGCSMAQIGEFAFIIVGLGCSLGVMREFIYPVVVTVSVITTFTTPYFIKLSSPLSLWLSKHLPPAMVKRFDENSSASKTITKHSDWKVLIKMYTIRVLMYSVLLFAIILASFTYLEPFVIQKMPDLSAAATDWICVTITLAVMSPFLYGLATSKGKLSSSFTKLWMEKRGNKYPLIALTSLRLFLAIGFCTSVFFHYFDFSYWVLGLIVVAVTVFVFFSRKNILRFDGLEKRFMENLNQKEEFERSKTPISSSVNSKLTGHDIRLESISVSPDSKYVGKQLFEVPFRKLYGINIVQIVRGSLTINIPSAEEHLYPYDTILVVGTQSQIKIFMEVMEEDSEGEKEHQHEIKGEEPIVVESFVVKDSSYIHGKTLSKVGMRDSGCMIIGVERSGESIMNPSPEFLFKAGDVVWMVGIHSACLWYM